MLGEPKRLRKESWAEEEKITEKERCIEKQKVKVCEDLEKQGRYPRTDFWYL